MIIASGTQVTFSNRSGVETIGDVVGLIDDDDNMYQVVDAVGNIHELREDEMTQTD